MATTDSVTGAGSSASALAALSSTTGSKDDGSERLSLIHI